MRIDYEKFEKTLERIAEQQRKFKKKEILQELLSKERDKIETLLARGISKKTIYEAVIKFFEEEGIKVSYRYFSEILNKVLKEKQTSDRKSKDYKTDIRPQKINPLDIL